MTLILGGTLLIGIGLMYELVSRKVSDTKSRVAIATAPGVALLIIWVELAVGVFGTTFSGS